MPCILHIKPAKGGKKMLLSLDDGTYLRVLPEVAEQMGLVAGMELTGGEIEVLSPSTEALADAEKASEAAARLLSRRPLSARELSEKLTRKGFAETAAADAVAHMQTLGFQDDAAYAAAWAAEYARRGLSARAMAAKLREKGLARETIDDALVELPPPDGTLDALVAAKAQGKPLDYALRRRIFQYLYGRGFASADIQAALQRYPSSDGFEEELE